MKTLRPYQQEVLDTLRGRLKETDYPLLVNASVGSGKSIIIAELLRIVERAGWRALCLTMNSTLIRQNADTYEKQGGHAGIYCAALGQKETGQPIIFASPMSVRGSIKTSGKLSKIPFNLIIVDECHNINFNDKNTTYMRIFNHYSHLSIALGHKLRFVGLTGTPYRGKGHTIVGEDQFFKEEVCAITAEWLIQENYLTPPIWGYCEKTLQYDFQELKVNSMGKFNSTELEAALHKKPRLTGKIMAEVSEIVKNRKGAFIFASSIKHCHECAEWLPPEETAIITGDTPDKMRELYITQARAGALKYLVNVNVLCTGVDVPTFDTVVFVRPTESLVLYMQCLGRGLRLAEGKTDCLILDYAGNLDRHGDIDNPIINKALQPKDPNDPEYCIECFDCGSMNTITARRCIGTKDEKRCDHRFEWKDCPGCETKNDIVSRQCRSCHIELIDPNRNLSDSASNKNSITLQVKETRYSLSIVNEYPRFDITYITDKGIVRENFLLSSTKAMRFFYHTIVKFHFLHPSQAYTRLHDIEYLKLIIDNGELYSPKSIECIEMNGGLKVVSKQFEHPMVDQELCQLDVLYTFYETCPLKNTITFEYLTLDLQSGPYNLITDKYSFTSTSSYKRFTKNYGSIFGDVKGIDLNSHLLETPTKIWVDANNKMQGCVENTPKMTSNDRYIFVLGRIALNRVYEQWLDIVKIKVIARHSETKLKNMFKVFRVNIYAVGLIGHECLKLIPINCTLTKSDLEKVQSKEYRYLKVIPDGRHAEDIEKWKTIDSKEFEKESCYNHRD